MDTVALAHQVFGLRDAVPVVCSPNDSLTLAIENEMQWRWGTSFLENVAKPWLRRVVLRYELAAYGAADGCHVVSKVDADYLKSRDNTLNPTVIPNGVDTDYFVPDHTQPTDAKTAAYVGRMSGGNARYLHWFLTEVWSTVRRHCSEAELKLIGSDAPPALVRLGHEVGGVRFVGRVDDTRPWFARARCAVCPVMKNCGIINKRLEPMAMGKPVVGTAMGFSGIPGARDGVSAKFATSAGEFAAGVLAMFESAEDAKRIGSAARNLMEQEYSWKGRSEQYVALYQDARDRHLGSKGSHA